MSHIVGTSSSSPKRCFIQLLNKRNRKKLLLRHSLNIVQNISVQSTCAISSQRLLESIFRKRVVFFNPTKNFRRQDFTVDSTRFLEAAVKFPQKKEVSLKGMTGLRINGLQTQDQQGHFFVLSYGFLRMNVKMPLIYWLNFQDPADNGFGPNVYFFFACFHEEAWKFLRRNFLFTFHS